MTPRFRDPKIAVIGFHPVWGTVLVRTGTKGLGKRPRTGRSYYGLDVKESPWDYVFEQLVLKWWQCFLTFSNLQRVEPT